jgi:hypothetical protein
MAFDMKELTEGISRQDMLKESARLVKKWERTGLLEGLADSPRNKAKSNMARLLESQAAQLLTESNSVGGDLQGFQNVAFPIVRRVFGGLIANELVSVQPLSLPSGLLFYLDYQYANVKAGNKNDDFSSGGSLFGDQTAPGTQNLATKGMYNLGTSYSMREKVSTQTFAQGLSAATLADVAYDPDLSGTIAAGQLTKLTLTGAYTTLSALGEAASDIAAIKQWMPLSGSSTSWAATTDGVPVADGSGQGTGNALIVYRRHTKVAPNGQDLVFIVSGTVDAVPQAKVSYTVGSTIVASTTGTLVLPNFESDFGATPTPVIPEINLKIQSTAVVTNTRKLRAKWTPELAQDLAAYQNLDAEVELTQVLSEAIALEIDREILSDLLYFATGANFFWSRKPGNFVDKTTGLGVSGASFTGTVREWYETLIETCIDVANNIHRKTLRGAANFMVTSPDVATILEASVLYKPILSMDPKETMFTVGTEKVGTLNNRFTVYKDPYFPRNRVLIGFKGGSFLETGYVYAPYVPLIVTPTIYAPEDFTPRKGVMTRYAKKLVRSDFYGTVTVEDMNVI